MDHLNTYSSSSLSPTAPSSKQEPGGGQPGGPVKQPPHQQQQVNMPPDYPVSPQPIVFYPSLAPAPHAPPPPFTAQVLRSKATSSAGGGGSGSTPTPTIHQFGAPTFVVPAQLQPQP